MKRTLGLAVVLVVAASGYAFAQEAKDFYSDLLVSDEVKTKEGSSAAISGAGKLLDSRPKALRIDKNQVVVKKARPQQQTQAMKKPDLAPAPFGLFWGMHAKDAKDLGIILTQVTRKDYKNVFMASHLPKPVADFEQVEMTFGEENELSRIIAYGVPVNDDAKASKSLEVYYKYYKMLDSKYGNAKQNFVPKMSKVEKTILNERGKEETIIEDVKSSIGDENFLEDLKNGEALLYSTFENNEVGVSLTISIGDDGLSYIIIDYKNLNLLRKKEAKILDAL